MDNNKIKEAFEKWFINPVTEQELAFGIECSVGMRAEDIHAMQVAGINFHGGYTAADREWREKLEALRAIYAEADYAKASSIVEKIDQILGR